jgi:uncharacterized protein (TIGR02271 family)
MIAMSARKIVAVFDSSEAAQTARTRLVERGIPREQINITDQSSVGERKLETPHARGSFWAHLKEMFMPDHDRHAYEESMRRGGYMVVASVDEAFADEAVACLDSAGAIDLDDRQNQWRSEGWQPVVDTKGAAGNETERIPVVEEELRIGKREVNRGSVRVRSYIVEEPVHEEVRLREERVSVERRPVNEPARPVVKGSPEDLLQERTVEVSETAEQAVVGKEARVTEQVVVGKSTGERVESVDDTVRRTKVDIEDDRQKGGRPRPKTEGPARDTRSRRP